MSLFWVMMMAKKKGSAVAKVKLYVKYVTWMNYWHFILILLTRYLFIYCIWFRSGGYIDHSTKSIFSIQLRRIIRNFFYIFFRGISLLTGGCCLKGKLTGPFPYWRLSLASTRNRSTRVSTKSSRWLIYFHIYSSLSVHHLLHHPSNSPHVRVCVWSKWTTFNCSHFK